MRVVDQYCETAAAAMTAIDLNFYTCRQLFTNGF